MQKLIAITLLPVVYLAAYGWGRQLERYIYRRSVQSSAYTVALGLLLWLVIGAGLNHMALAVPMALNILLAVGIAWAVMELQPCLKRAKQIHISGEHVPVGITLLFGLFFAWTVLPSSAFNFHDDFYKYLPRAIGMLQTGTLAGNPLDLVGLDSLGSHAYLQGFFITHLPFHYLNAFDAVFCLVLSGLLLDFLGRKVAIHWAIRSLAVLTLLVLNPQYVNTAAVYSGIALIVALTVATLLLVESLHERGADFAGYLAVPVGGFAAAIASLKITLVPYASAYLLILLALALARPETRTFALRPALSAGMAALALYGSWATLSLQKLGDLGLQVIAKMTEVTDSLLLNATNTRGARALKPTGDQALEQQSYLESVLNQGELYYGGHMLHYLVMAVFLCALATVSMILLARQSTFRVQLLPAGATALGGVASVIGVFLGVYGIHVDALVRYNAPVLVSTPLIAALLLYGVPSVPRHQFLTRVPARPLAMIALLSSLLAMQGGLWLERAEQALAEGHLLSYPLPQGHLAYQAEVLSDSMREDVRAAQSHIPEGARILAWVSMPFHFNFQRNKILTFAGPERMPAILRVPSAERAEWMRQRLKREGVDYVVWEYRGLPKQRGGQGKDAIKKALATIAGEQRVIYSDSNWVVFGLASGGR